MTNNDTPLTEKIPIEELVAMIPASCGILRRFGLVCIQCGEPVWGTLEDLAREKGITDLEPILAALRQARKEK